jgi:hypothetical protein
MERWAVPRVFPALVLLTSLAAVGVIPACAKTTCAPAAEAGVIRCVSGLRPAEMAAMFQAQHASNWCWAASIAMILLRYGLKVPQEELVRTAFGRAANERASVQAMGALLNRGWDDAQGRAVVVSSGPLPPWRRSFGLAAPEVLDDLAHGRPLLLVAQQHAMVLIQVIYELRIDGKPLSVAGVRIVKALVLDPGSRDWPRSLEPAERRPEFVARTAVEVPPAHSAGAQAPGAQDAGRGDGSTH